MLQENRGLFLKPRINREINLSQFFYMVASRSMGAGVALSFRGRRYFSSLCYKSLMRIIALAVLPCLSYISIADEKEFFQPLAYGEAGGWVSPQSSPKEVCSKYASLWRWNQNGYSAQLERSSPGLWKCQRYYMGARDEANYTLVHGMCQTSPAQIKTGESWNYPYSDSSKPVSCYCSGGSKFRYDVQWCDYRASSIPSPNKQTGNPDTSDNAPTACQGNSINSATGNKFQIEADYAAANHSIRFERFYNSDNGFWRHTFSGQIIVDSGTITLIHADGRHESFIIVGARAEARFSPVGFFTQEGNNWSYHAADMSVTEFNSEGLPIRIKPLQGQEVLLSHTLNSVAVTGLPGGDLVLDMDPMRQPLRLSIGSLEVQYTYNSAGRLTQLTRTRAGQSAQRTFHYEVARDAKLLTGITDEKGIRFATWSYDGQGRAISSEHADGAEKVLIAYNADGSSTVTNELGKKATYRFQTIEGIKRITAIEGEPSANCPNSNSTFTYDERGLLKTKADNKGHLTTYDYNERGLEVSRTEAVGTPQARTVTTDWHPTLFLPVTVTEPGRITHYTYDDQGRQLGRTVEIH